MQFCEVITVSWLKHLSGQVVRVLLDYVDHVTLCSKLKAAVMEHQQWSDICGLQGKRNGTWHFHGWTAATTPCLLLLFLSREHSLSAASLSPAHPSLSWSPSTSVTHLHELPAFARATEGLRPVSRVWHVQPEEWISRLMEEWRNKTKQSNWITLI